MGIAYLAFASAAATELSGRLRETEQSAFHPSFKEMLCRIVYATTLLYQALRMADKLDASCRSFENQGAGILQEEISLLRIALVYQEKMDKIIKRLGEDVMTVPEKIAMQLLMKENKEVREGQLKESVALLTSA